MKSTKCFLIIALAVFVATGISSADQWPENVLQKVNEINGFEAEKKEMPVSLLESVHIPVLTGEEAYKMWKANKASILDVRPRTQYETERVEGASHLPVDDLINDPSLANGFDKEKEYALYCNGVKCPRSPRAAVLLHHMGFKKLYWYREGMPDWKSKGYPTE